MNVCTLRYVEVEEHVVLHRVRFIVIRGILMNTCMARFFLILIFNGLSRVGCGGAAAVAGGPDLPLVEEVVQPRLD